MKGYTKCRFTGRQILKPGLTLIGAKEKLRDLLYQLMEPHDVYIEPFVGSTTIATGKVPVGYEVIGDTNTYLLNWLDWFTNHPETVWDQLKPEIEKMKEGGRQRFLEVRDLVTETKDPISRAIYFYLITKSCFNGIWRLHGTTGKCNSSYCKDAINRGWFTEEWFFESSRRQDKFMLHLGDFKSTIALGLKQPGEKFLFLDPPYRQKKGKNGAGTVTTYNGQKFYDEDLEDLEKVMRSFPGKVLMTINDDEWTRDLFKDYYQIRHNVHYQCSQTPAGRGKRPELLVANYLVQEKYDSCMEILNANTKTNKKRKGASEVIQQEA